MRLEAGKVISDRYEIKEQLGSGGMAIVYRALDLKLDRSVTLKVMREDLQEGFIERFYKEAQSVASLSHANIVKVYDYGEDDGIHYIVMEYVDGTTLKDLIVKKAPFDEESTLGVAVQIANGLLHAHKSNVVHRDIKPQNILVTHDGSVKIADFGIARVAKATTLTSNANSMGSVHYFSPEQARGGFVDHKSDIYALGITMFEMATGKLPYDGEVAVTVALKHINDPFPDPQEINPGISDHLRHIICKACEKSSTKRYAAIEDMYRDMKRTINNVEFLEHPSFNDSPTVPISSGDMESIRKHRRDYSEEIRQAYEEDEPYEDEKTDRRVVIAAFSTAAVLVGLITFASILLYNNLRTRSVNPPYIVGLTMAQAEREAEALGLFVVSVGELFSEEHEAGIIIEQSVGPDGILRIGETIHVELSRGSAYFPMPNLLNLERERALGELEGLYLEIEEVEYVDADIPANIVVRTEPDVGIPISQHQIVRLYVSLGPDNSPFPMISLLGMDEVMTDEAGAETSIVDFIQDELRLIVGNISHQSNAMYVAGTVMWQSVAPNELVMAGQVIDITISTGAVIPSPPPPTPTPEPQENGTEPDDGAGTPVVPTPSPEPIPDPPDIPQPDIPAVEPVTSVLNIALWDVPEEVETVHLRIYRRIEGGSAEMFVDHTMPVASFPIAMPIYGTGMVQYLIYSIDEGVENRRAISNVDFSLLQ